MAGSAGGDEEGVISGINVTPLVDICLVLLIIMMVTARIIANTSIPMDLPKAKTGGDQQVFFRIDLVKDGATFVDGRNAESPEIVLGLAKEAFSKNAELRATIGADSSVPHGRVMETVDLLKQAGITKIAFGVSPKTEAAPSP